MVAAAGHLVVVVVVPAEQTAVTDLRVRLVDFLGVVAVVVIEEMVAVAQSASSGPAQPAPSRPLTLAIFDRKRT